MTDEPVFFILATIVCPIALEIFVIFALATKIISDIPNKDITVLKGRSINPINGIKGRYILDTFRIKNANIIQYVSTLYSIYRIYRPTF